MTTYRILFSPNQHPHFLNLTIVDSVEELSEHWEYIKTKYPEGEVLSEEFDLSIGAFCAYNYGSGEDLGDIVFYNMTYPVVAHECTHAAISFFDHKISQSKVVLAMSQDEQHEYYHEALATTVENLFAQIQEIMENGFK